MNLHRRSNTVFDWMDIAVCQMCHVSPYQRSQMKFPEAERLQRWELLFTKGGGKTPEKKKAIKLQKTWRRHSVTEVTHVFLVTGFLARLMK